MGSGYKPATINKALSALRGTLRAAWQMGQMGAEEYHRAASVDNVRGETLPAGRDLSEGEIRALMACCSEDIRPAGFRDAALIAVLCLGLRRAEGVALDVDNYDPETGALKLTGKGRKERLVYAYGGGGGCPGGLATDAWRHSRAAVLPHQKGWRDRTGPADHPGRVRDPQVQRGQGGCEALLSP